MKRCVICNKQYIPKVHNAKYCSYKCRKKAKKDDKERWCEENIKRIKEYSKKYYKNNKAMLFEKKKRYLKTRKGKERKHKSDTKWRHGNPEKRRAGAAVYRAVKKGEFKKQPCEVCGKEEVHAHHHDYSKPLEVIWFCSQHHVDKHKEIS